MSAKIHRNYVRVAREVRPLSASDCSSCGRRCKSCRQHFHYGSTATDERNFCSQHCEDQYNGVVEKPRRRPHA